MDRIYYDRLFSSVSTLIRCPVQCTTLEEPDLVAGYGGVIAASLARNVRFVYSSLCQLLPSQHCTIARQAENAFLPSEDSYLSVFGELPCLHGE